MIRVRRGKSCRYDLHAYSMHKSSSYAARRPNDAFSLAWSRIRHELPRGPLEIYRGCLFKASFFSTDVLYCTQAHSPCFNRVNDETPPARSRSLIREHLSDGSRASSSRPNSFAPYSESSRRVVSSLSARIRCPLIVVELEKSGTGRVRLHSSRLKIKLQRELRILALGNKDKSHGVNEERRNKLFSENQDILPTRKPQTYAYLFYFVSYLCLCSTCTDRNARWFIFPIEIVGLVTANAMIPSALGPRLTFSGVKREGGRQGVP